LQTRRRPAGANQVRASARRRSPPNGPDIKASRVTSKGGGFPAPLADAHGARSRLPVIENGLVTPIRSAADSVGALGSEPRAYVSSTEPHARHRKHSPFTKCQAALDASFGTSVMPLHDNTRLPACARPSAGIHRQTGGTFSEPIRRSVSFDIGLRTPCGPPQARFQYNTSARAWPWTQCWVGARRSCLHG
jgi:hypothetical protein